MTLWCPDSFVLKINNSGRSIFKPIFHCDAKPLASGPCVGLQPQRDDFALPIPTCWYLKMRKQSMPNLKFAAPNARPKCKSVEYRLCWVPNAKFSVGHFHFMFFVLISFAFGSQCKPSFQWNMGFRDLVISQQNIHKIACGYIK